MTNTNIKIFRLLMWSAIEYFAGYEFPVWRKGQWKKAAQYKLDYFMLVNNLEGQKQ